MTNVKRAGNKTSNRINTKGRFKTKIPSPGDTYRKDIEIFKKSNHYQSFNIYNSFSFTIIIRS